MRALAEQANNVSNQKELAEFVANLAIECAQNGHEWTNGDLSSFLEALSSWIAEMDGYYENSGQPYDERQISWRKVADMLFASTMYE